MKKIYLAALSTMIAMTVTACGTISPPVQTPPEAAVTEPVESVIDPTASSEAVDKLVEEQIDLLGNCRTSPAIIF